MHFPTEEQVTRKVLGLLIGVNIGIRGSFFEKEKFAGSNVLFLAECILPVGKSFFYNDELNILNVHVLLPEFVLLKLLLKIMYSEGLCISPLTVTQLSFIFSSAEYIDYFEIYQLR